ncbi:unnamed protein product [Phaeothamnion confervicola]
MLRGLAASSITSSDASAALVERPETRIFGIGVGVFLILLFGAISLATCCIGLTTDRPCSFATAATILFLLVLVVLFSGQQESKYEEQNDDVLEEYATGTVARAAVFAILMVFTIFGVLSTVWDHIITPMYATPLHDPPTTRRRRPFF